MNKENQSELIPLSAGDLLLQARQKQGLDLVGLAQQLKIKPEVLSAIESGNTEHIPAVYLKGYMRSYAQRLGVSAAEIEQALPQVACSEPAMQAVFKERLPRHRGDRWLKATSYVLASAVVIALVWQFTNEAVRFSQGEAMIRAAGTLGSDTAAGSADTSESPVLPGNAAKPAADGKEPTASAAPAKTHLRASIAAMNPAGDGRGSTHRSAAEGAWAAIGKREATADTSPATEFLGPVSSAGAESLSISTSADSWVEIVDGQGNLIEMDLLRAGSRRNYSGAPPFRMLLGRAASVEVFHNGQKVDLAPYTRGNVARFNLGNDVDAPAQATDEPVAEDPAPPRQG